MPVLNMTFMSNILGMQSSAVVILPQSSPENKINKPFKTLYLLHGLSDDHTAWTRYTSIERYAAKYNIAVVMPNAHRSFYSDKKNGGQYFKFVSEELIEIMQEFFSLSDKREDRYAAGLSMGGYGAMKLGLACPEKFAAVASLSGALDIEMRVKDDIEMRVKDNPESEFSYMLKLPEEERRQNDLFYLAEKLNASNQPKPRIYIWCGTEDFLYQDNIKFRDFLKKSSFDFVYEEAPGDHSWGYWDTQIQTVLRFMFGG